MKLLFTLQLFLSLSFTAMSSQIKEDFLRYDSALQYGYEFSVIESELLAHARSEGLDILQIVQTLFDAQEQSSFLGENLEYVPRIDLYVSPTIFTSTFRYFVSSTLKEIKKTESIKNLRNTFSASDFINLDLDSLKQSFSLNQKMYILAVLAPRVECLIEQGLVAHHKETELRELIENLYKYANNYPQWIAGINFSKTHQKILCENETQL